MHSKYDGLLASVFLYQENIAQALPFAHNTIKRIEKTQPSPYLQFSEATLLIAQKNLQEALDLSQQLNNYLATASDNLYPFLQFSNLIRIATLSQRLELASEEATAWIHIKELRENEAHLPVVFEHINSLFREGETSLANYMEERLDLLGVN